MIPQKAKIQQLQFVIMYSLVEIYVAEDATKVDLSQIPIDIDFDILQNLEETPHLVRIVMTIKGNCEKAVSGYVFELKVGGEYKVSDELEVMGDNYKSLVQGSAVACLINEVRVYLQTITSFYPFKSYIMPMIDMKDLWEKKSLSDKEAAE